MYATMPKVAVDDAVPLTLYSHSCGASGMEMNSDMKQTLVATASQAILGCRLRNKNLKQLIESSELPFEFSAFINVSRLSPANFSVRSDAPGEGRRGKREVGERSNDAWLDCKTWQGKTVVEVFYELETFSFSFFSPFSLLLGTEAWRMGKLLVLRPKENRWKSKKLLKIMLAWTTKLNPSQGWRRKNSLANCLLSNSIKATTTPRKRIFSCWGRKILGESA
jgi:hypothetical protein